MNCMKLAVAIVGFLACLGPSHAGDYTWHQAPDAPWGTTRVNAVLAFRNELWAFPGCAGKSNPFIAWRSSNGQDWIEAQVNLEWLATCDYPMFVLGEKICLLESLAGNVWSSRDAIDWHSEASGAPWSPRSSATVVPFDGRAWLLGGVTSGAPWPSDVWSSTDGKDWVQVTPHAPWGGRAGHGCIAYKGRLWMTGGVDSFILPTNFNDAWYSSDGATWIQATSNAPWHARFGHTLAVFDDKLWLFGGYYCEGSGPNAHTYSLYDTWCSEDGVNWVQPQIDVPWPWGHPGACAVLNSKLWMVFEGDSAGTTGSYWYMTAPSHEGQIDAPRGGWFEVGDPLVLTAQIPNLVGATTYQWSKDGVDIADATGAVYQRDAAGPEDAGWYTVTATDEAKAVHVPPPALIHVFPAGSLPAAGTVALAVTIWALARAARKRRRL